MFERTWMVTNPRDIVNHASIAFHRTGESESYRLWLPFTNESEDEGSLYVACAGFRFGDCCLCDTAAFRRYGDMGVMGDTNDSLDPAFAFLPTHYTDATGHAGSQLAWVHQSTAGVYQNGGTPAYPITCSYLARPKREYIPSPLVRERTTPRIHYSFDSGNITGNVVTNLGYLGTNASTAGLILGDCIGGGGGDAGITSGVGEKGDGAIAFNGDPTSCRIEIPSSVYPMVWMPWTIMFWFKFSATLTTQRGQVFFARMDDSGEWSPYEYLIYSYDGVSSSTGQSIDTIGAVGHNIGYIMPEENMTPNDHAWHHYAFTSTGLAGKGRAYVDGVEVEQYRQRDQPINHGKAWRNNLSPGNMNVTLGGTLSKTTGHASTGANGTMDEFKWFSAALTVQEIRTAAGIDPVECDDGNELFRDGCDGSRIEAGWTCPGESGSDCERAFRRARPVDPEDNRPAVISRTCSHLMATSPGLRDGNHMVGPEGDRHRAYCQREATGDASGQAAWTVVLQKGYGAGPVSYTPSASEIGDPGAVGYPASDGNFHKLRDAHIVNAQMGLWGSRNDPRHIVRIRTAEATALDGKHLYIQYSLGKFNDLLPGWGLFRKGARVGVCRAASLAECTGFSQRTIMESDSFDTTTLDPALVAATAERVFVDSPDSATPIGCMDGGTHLNDGTRCVSHSTGSASEAFDISILTHGPICGDAVVDPALEECDDGNTLSGDGCSMDCRIEPGYSCSPPGPLFRSNCLPIAANQPVCGDGKLEATRVLGAPGYEECDDGNLVSGDGCTANCTIEYGVCV